jgi:hypothetical protein
VTLALSRNIDLAAVKLNPSAHGRTTKTSPNVIESLA